MKNIFSTLIFTLLISVVFAQDGRLTPEGLWDLGRVSLDDVSPDGKSVLYGVTRYDVASETSNRDLYLVPSKGGRSIKLTEFEGSEYNGAYHPDGKRIGFLKD